MPSLQTLSISLLLFEFDGESTAEGAEERGVDTRLLSRSVLFFAPWRRSEKLFTGLDPKRVARHGAKLARD